MQFEFDPKQPIYQQIIDHMIFLLAGGHYQPGARIPPVRELAIGFGVNPNTVQKALVELERSGYLYSERTSGRFVTEDTHLLNSLKDKIPEKLLSKFVSDMTSLGIKRNEITGMVDSYLRNHN